MATAARGASCRRTPSKAFRYLQEIGAPAVEIDVQNAAGRVPVVVHDPLVPMQIARDAAGNWLPAPGPKVHDLTVEALRSYDVGRLNPGHAYGTRYPDQRPVDGARIPTLDDVLAWLDEAAGMILNIEIKSDPTRPDLGDPPEMLVDDVLSAVARRGLAERIVVSSFDWRVLSALREAAPQVARAYLSFEEPGGDLTIYPGSPWMDGLELAEFGGSLPRLIAAQGALCWCPYFRDVTADRVAEAHRLGLAVNVWTVNAADDIRAMIEWGSMASSRTCRTSPSPHWPPPRRALRQDRRAARCASASSAIEVNWNWTVGRSPGFIVAPKPSSAWRR
jgi:glycerophosphoryl diester phosphodiesterase